MFRIGIGYDSHRLVAGRPLILGGVTIAHERGLLGHSDADVLCHALCDALLGAAALGDIGQLFPDHDPQWQGADSTLLLAKVVALLKQKGWRVNNVDASIIAEAPRLARHLPAMRQRLAPLLGVTIEQVSVKATTNEGMGAVGRGEGINVVAVATLCAHGQPQS